MKSLRLFFSAVALCFVVSMFTGCELFFDLKDNPINTTLSMPTLELTLYEGQTAVRKATTASPGAITYTSSDTNVATVDAEGNVTAHKMGTATITAHVAEIDYWSSAEVSYQVRVLKRNTLATINLNALNVFQDPQNKIIKQVPVAKLTLKSSWLPGGELVCDDQIASPSSTIKLDIINPPSGKQSYDIVATDTNGDEWTAQNVSLDLVDGTNPDKDISLYNATFCPLTIEATEDATTINIADNSGITYSYSINGNSLITKNTSDPIAINAGDVVQFFSSNPATAAVSNPFRIEPNKTSYVYGNVMSLIDDGPDGFANDKVIGADYALCYLFSGADKIIFHNTKKLELPATTLANNCYERMFNGCTGLTSLPEKLLPATTLADYCYDCMFDGCTGLTSLPEKLLPATQLADCCYANMFYGCTGLTSLPEDLLPATILKVYCYCRMFCGCSGLTSLPETFLSATNLAGHCYFAMFYGCTGLTSLPENLLPATTLVNNCYHSMFNNCTNLKNTPILPALELVKHSYCSMFNSCSKLEKVTCLATSYTEANSLSDWLQNAGTSATGTKTIIVNSGFTIDANNATTAMPQSGGTAVWGGSRSDSGIPAGWKVQIAQ